MNMKSRTLGLMCMCLLVLVAMTSSANAQDNMGMKSDIAKMSSMDQKFMMTAAMGGMAEVEMARLALEKSGSDAVKQYAQKMIDDHTAANNELMQVASSKGVTLPTQPSPKQMAMMRRMQNLSGAQFDMMYIKEAGVKAHQEMEKLFMRESTGGRDADAKGFASKTLPVVRMHLQMAREMMGSMKGTGGGMSGMSTHSH